MRAVLPSPSPRWPTCSPATNSVLAQACLGGAHVLAFAIIAMLENPLYVSQTSTPALATCSHVMSYFNLDIYIDALALSQQTHSISELGTKLFSYAINRPQTTFPGFRGHNPLLLPTATSIHKSPCTKSSIDRLVARLDVMRHPLPSLVTNTAKHDCCYHDNHCFAKP
jgi:hypothetical protein